MSSEEEALTDTLKQAQQDDEREILQELVGIDDPDEFEERKKDIEQEVRSESELLDILHAKAQNANKESALFFESLKHRMTEQSRQKIHDASEDKVEGEIKEFVERMVSVQLIIDVLREGPTFSDISKRLDKIDDFIGQEGDTGSFDLEEGDIDFG